MNIELCITKRTQPNLIRRMAKHYSQPKGFVGRNICCAILYNGLYYGHIVGGSATRFLPNRHAYLGTTDMQLNNIVNNVFYNVSTSTKYPLRNFTTEILHLFRNKIYDDWYTKYNDIVLGFETLVEQPRMGTCYLRDSWVKVGETRGYTCKRVAGIGTDTWSGKRVWCTDPTQLRPKNILCRKV